MRRKAGLLRICTTGRLPCGRRPRRRSQTRHQVTGQARAQRARIQDSVMPGEHLRTCPQKAVPLAVRLVNGPHISQLEPVCSITGALRRGVSRRESGAVGTCPMCRFRRTCGSPDPGAFLVPNLQEADLGTVSGGHIGSQLEHFAFVSACGREEARFALNRNQFVTLRTTLPTYGSPSSARTAHPARSDGRPCLPPRGRSLTSVNNMPLHPQPEQG